MADHVESRVPLLGLVHKPTTNTALNRCDPVNSSSDQSSENTIKTEKKDIVIRRNSLESQVISLLSDDEDDDEDSNNNNKIQGQRNFNFNAFNALSASSSDINTTVVNCDDLSTESCSNNPSNCSMEEDKGIQLITHRPDSNETIMIFDDESLDGCEDNQSAVQSCDETNSTVSASRAEGVNSHIDFSVFNVVLSDDEEDQDNSGTEIQDNSGTECQYEDISEAGDLEVEVENTASSYNFNTLCGFSPQKAKNTALSECEPVNSSSDQSPVENNSDGDISSNSLTDFNNASMNCNINESFTGLLPSIVNSGLRNSPEPRETTEISAPASINTDEVTGQTSEISAPSSTNTDVVTGETSEISVPSSNNSHVVTGGDLNTSSDSVRSGSPDQNLTDTHKDTMHVLSHEQAMKDLDQELNCLLEMEGSDDKKSTPGVNQTESEMEVRGETAEISAPSSINSDVETDNLLTSPPVTHPGGCNKDNTSSDTEKNQTKPFNQHQDIKRKLTQINLSKEKIKVGLEILKLSKTTIISQCKCPKNQQYIANIDFLCKYYQQTSANIKEYYKNKLDKLTLNQELSFEEREQQTCDCHLDIIAKYDFMLNRFTASMDTMLKQVKNSCNYCESSAGGSLFSPPLPAHGSTNPPSITAASVGHAPVHTSNTNSSNQNPLQRRPRYIQPKPVPCNTAPHNMNTIGMNNVSNMGIHNSNNIGINTTNNMVMNNTHSSQLAQAHSRMQQDFSLCQATDNFQTRTPTLPLQTSIPQVSPTEAYNQAPYAHIAPQQAPQGHYALNRMPHQGQMPPMGQGQYMHSSGSMAPNNNGMAFMHPQASYQQSQGQLSQQRPSYQRAAFQGPHQQGGPVHWYPTETHHQARFWNSVSDNRKRKATHPIMPQQQQSKFPRLNNNGQW